VPHRNLAALAQVVQDLETVGLAYVLEVDRPDGRLEHFDELDDLVGIMHAFLVP
jgi:hypothetical protein